MKWIELCAGSAACTLAIAVHGKPPQLVPYLGGKRRFAQQSLGQLGMWWQPSGVVLVEAGPWGEAWPVMIEPSTRAQIVAGLQALDTELPAELWARLAAEPVPVDRVERVTRWVALAAGNALGKPVRAVDGQWKTAGFAKLSPSAVRLGFQERFRPRLLAAKVDLVGRLMAQLAPEVVHGRVEDWPAEVAPGDRVLIDPPYQGTTGYGITFEREAVITLALALEAAGAKVGVCEAQGLTDCLPGWRAVPLKPADLREKRLAAEWITVSP